MKQKTYLPGKLCDRVRDLREEWGLTRKELAERSGVDESLLGRIENNKNKKVSDEAVQAFAKFFSVSTDFLLGLTDIPDRKNYDIEELPSSVFMQVWSAGRRVKNIHSHENGDATGTLR